MDTPSRSAKRVGSILGGFLMVAGCASSTTERLHLPPLRTVAHVDLSRYLGTWCEIASFPQRFQRGCTATTAIYTPRDDGKIDVLNRCRKDALDGPEKSAHGPARVDHATNAKLEVSFFRPFWGDYWIIDLADDYSYAVVGHPGRDYLWIPRAQADHGRGDLQASSRASRLRATTPPASCARCRSPKVESSGMSSIAPTRERNEHENGYRSRRTALRDHLGGAIPAFGLCS